MKRLICAILALSSAALAAGSASNGSGTTHTDGSRGIWAG